jgi:glycine/D-amino acid oxidase-like deaminating enzyme
VTVRLYEAQTTRAARRVTTLRVPNQPTGVVGIYDVADDWTPIYDKTDAPGFYVAIGTSGNQFKNAPIVGQFMATLIDAVENGHDHDADPVSFTCQYTGRAIDLSAFSRRRPPNAATSGTVLG